MTARAVLDASAAVRLVLNGEYAAQLAAKRRSSATVITADRTFALKLRDMEIESYCPLLLEA